MQRYKNYVNGTYINNHTKECFAVVNPATAKQIYEVEIADDTVLNTALESAAAGFKVWSAMDTVKRSRILMEAVSLLRKRNQELAEIEVMDTGKPFQEAVAVDVLTGADVIEFFAWAAPGISGSQQDLGQDFYYTRREPLGVCAGIGAWNYPLQIACWKSGPAIACGNSMIFKPSEETPLGALKLAEIFTEAGVPDGVFNVVQGAAPVGQWLTACPGIEKISFTGEVGTGRKVMTSAASTLKDVTMELGGKSALIVFEDADLDQAVSAAMLGNFYTQGEVCTNCTRVFVHTSIQEKFLKKLLDRIRANIKIGDPMDPDTNFGALISDEHRRKVLAYIKSANTEGATQLCGHTMPDLPNQNQEGFFLPPTVFTNCTDDMTLVREEVFGPVMAVLDFDTEAEVIQRANATRFGLAAGVFTKDIQRAHRVIHKIKAGICWINAYGSSPAQMPVGGYKQSGIGRENGLETIRHYTQVKSVYVGMGPLDSPF